MAKNDYEDDRDHSGAVNGATVLAAETLRASSSKPVPPALSGKGEDRISMFWRVCGGTVLSILGLILVTAYNQINGSMGELRHDLNQVQEARADLVKKDEFNNRLTTLWNAIKELQAANGSIVALNERAKVLDQQLQMQGKASAEGRKDFRRQIDDCRKADADERKDLLRKVEELGRLVQTLSERLAAVEGRQSVTSPDKKGLLTGKKK